MKTKPEERTARRRQKLLFDHLEIEKIFPAQESHHDVGHPLASSSSFFS
jgi:hypothetical protein